MTFFTRQTTEPPDHWRYGFSLPAGLRSIARRNMLSAASMTKSRVAAVHTVLAVSY